MAPAKAQGSEPAGSGNEQPTAAGIAVQRGTRARRLPSKLQNFALSAVAAAKPAATAGRKVAGSAKQLKGIQKPGKQRPTARAGEHRSSRGSLQLATRCSDRARKLPARFLASRHRPAPASAALPFVSNAALCRLSNGTVQPDAELGKRKRQLPVKLEDSVLQLRPRRDGPILLGRPAKRARATGGPKRTEGSRWGTGRRRRDSSRQHTPIVLRLKPLVKLEGAGVVIKQEQEDPTECAPVLPQNDGQPTAPPALRKKVVSQHGLALKLRWSRVELPVPPTPRPLRLKLQSTMGAIRSRSSRREAGGGHHNRRSLFRKCKLTVSLARQLLSDSEEETAAPEFTMQTRSAARHAQRPGGGHEHLRKASSFIKSEVSGDGDETADESAARPRLIIKLRETDELPEEAQAKASLSKERRGAAGDAAREAENKETTSKPKARLSNARRPVGAGKGTKRRLPAEGASCKHAPAVKRMAFPAGSLVGALSKQCRMFPELPPKLVSPNRCFSIPVITRESPGGHRFAIGREKPARRAAPSIRKAAQKAPSTAKKRLLPLRLLRQARAVRMKAGQGTAWKLPAAAVAPAAKASHMGVDCQHFLGALEKAAVEGLSVDMDAVARILKATPATEQPQLWSNIQTVILQHSLQLLLQGLRTTALPSTSQAKLTAGVSYVLRSSSQQIGLEGKMAPLPHTVIRPPVTPSAVNPRISDLLSVLESRPVAAVVLPLREDAQVKQYLLEGTCRLEMVAATGGQLRTVAGASGLDQLLQDRSFVCLHYHLDTSGALEPCCIKPCNGSSNSGYGLADSNLQIGMTVRRGVGGTCPARVAGRRLGQQGILAALLDQQPPFSQPDLQTSNPLDPKITGDLMRTEAPDLGRDKADPVTPPSACQPGTQAQAAQPHTARLVTEQQPPPLRPAAVAQLSVTAAQPLDSSAASEEQGGLAAIASRLASQAASKVQALSQQTQPQPVGQPGPGSPAANHGSQPTPAEQSSAALNKQPSPASAAALPAEQRRRQAARGEAEWLLGEEEEGMEELLQEVDTLLDDPSDPEYRPQSSQEEGGSSSSSSGTIQSRDREADEHSQVRQRAARMLAAGALTGHPRLRLYTRSCRLEMYVAQELWESLDGEQHCNLMGAIRELEVRLGRQQMRWNQNSLLAFAEGLERSLGSAALDSQLAAALLGSHRVNPVKVELRVTNDLERPIALRLRCGQPTAESSTHGSTKIAAEVEAVVEDLLEAACACFPSDPSEEVEEVLSRLVGKVCRASEATQPAHLLKAAAKEEGDDVKLQQEHNSLFVLASAVASAQTGRAPPSDFPWPYYFIGTRDCFTFNLLARSKVVEACGRKFTERRFFFPAGQVPCDYHAVVQRSGERNPTEAAASAPTQEPLPTGIVTYTEVYTEEEMRRIEASADKVDMAARAGELPAMCFHVSQSRSGHLKRTKFFFGARYLWTHEQLAAGAAKIAGGVRVDVPPPRLWMKSQVEQPLVQAGLLESGFVDSWALNLYHDGSEGIQSHFDDAGRFQRPITSLRLMSDSRLSFGTQLYGYTNGAFYVDMPRGCVTVMEAGGYAATGLKHCVRPVDMAGRSAALIMRKIRPEAMAAARQLAVDEAGEWLAALALRDGATPPSLLSKMRADIAARERQEAHLQREVWKVLDGCIRSVEASNRPHPQPRKPQLRPPTPAAAWQTPQLRALARLVAQVEQLMLAEVRRAEAAAHEVQAVMERCLASIEASATDRQASQEPAVTPRAPHPIHVQQPVGSEKLLQLARGLAIQLATPPMPLRSLPMTPFLARPPMPAPLVRPQGAPLLPQLGPAWPGTATAATAPQQPASPMQLPVAPVQPPGVGNAPAASWLLAVLAACQAPSVKPPQKRAPNSLPLKVVLQIHQSSCGETVKLLISAPEAPAPAPVPYIPGVPMLPPMLPQVNMTALIAPRLHTLISSMREYLGLTTTQQAPAAPPAQQQNSRLPADSAAAGLSPRPTPGQNLHIAVSLAQPGCSQLVRPSGGLQGIVAQIMAAPQSAPRSQAAVSAAPRMLPAAASSGSPASTSLTVLQTELAALVAQMQASSSQQLPVVKVQPMKAQQYSLAKSAKRAASSAALIPGKLPLQLPGLLGAQALQRLPVTPQAPRKQERGSGACWGCYSAVNACPAAGTQEGLVWSCGGPCRRSFHLRCSQPKDAGGMLLCSTCRDGRHLCAICGEPGGAAGELRKCSMSRCGLFFHLTCTAQQPLVHINPGGASFRCPQHYCAGCGRSGDSIAMVHCMRCCVGYHCRCRPPGCRQLTKKLIVCDKHA